MKPLKISVAMLLAGFFTTASATAPSAEALKPPVNAVVMQASFNPSVPPLALASLQGAEARRIQGAEAAQQASIGAPVEKDDFTLGLAGALMMCMVVIKRFSR